MKRSEIKRRPFADTVLSTLEAEAKEYREHDGNSLYLRVRPDGSKSWQLRYKKPDGKWSWLGLGGYPEVGGALARQKAAELRSDAAQGSNPLATKRARKAAENEAAGHTFESLAREWYSNKRLGWSDGTAIRTIGALELHVFPVFGKRIYREILPMEWMDFLRAMESTGIIEQTSRVRGMCREIYDLARVTGRATHNPLEGLHKFLQTKPAENYAHVSSGELPPLLRAIRSYTGATDVRIGLQLLSTLACRVSPFFRGRGKVGSFLRSLSNPERDRSSHAQSAGWRIRAFTAFDEGCIYAPPYGYETHIGVSDNRDFRIGISCSRIRCFYFARLSIASGIAERTFLIVSSSTGAPNFSVISFIL